MPYSTAAVAAASLAALPTARFTTSSRLTATPCASRRPMRMRRPAPRRRLPRTEQARYTPWRIRRRRWISTGLPLPATSSHSARHTASIPATRFSTIVVAARASAVWWMTVSPSTTSSRSATTACDSRRRRPQRWPALVSRSPPQARGALTASFRRRRAQPPAVSIPPLDAERHWLRLRARAQYRRRSRLQEGRGR